MKFFFYFDAIEIDLGRKMPDRLNITMNRSQIYEYSVGE